MSTIEFLFADQNGPFLVAMVVTLLIAAVEVLSLTLGLGLSDLIDDLIPDLDGGLEAELDVDVDLDMDADAEIGGGEAGEGNVFLQAFGWLNVGRVPFLILLICGLAIFTLVGYGAQIMAKAFVGLIPAMIAGPAAAAVTLPATRAASRVLARMVPREETYAVSEAQFVGLVGTVTLGPVEADNPGKTRIVDRHGNVHYVRVRAADAEQRFETGSEVLLVSRDGALFDVVRPPDSLTGI